MSRNLITAITRVKTVNIGNEALSSELMRLLSGIAADRGQQATALERAPRHLAQFTWRKLHSNPVNAIDQVERWASQLSQITPDLSVIVPERSIELVFEQAQDSRVIALKERLQLRRWAARAGAYKSEFAQRLGLYARSSNVILNPAGELNPQSIDPPLRMLTELRAAQKMGARVGVINFSFEIPEPSIGSLFAGLFNRFDFIAVRDHLSHAVLVEAGVNAAHVKVIPDLAFMTEPEAPAIGRKLAEELGIAPGTIAVIVNGRTGTSTVKDWSVVVASIREAGHPVILLSNELSSDLLFARELAKNSGARLIERQFSYRTYAALLRELRLVVSNRLHTAVLSMVAGTPVIAVEPIFRRIQGVMEEVGHPYAVPCVRKPNWATETVALVQKALSDEVALRDQLPEMVLAARRRISAGYSKLF